MKQSFGLRGRVEITIKKPDGRVAKQTIYNALDQNVYEELANRMSSNTLGYDNAYQPAELKIYVKGHDSGGGTPSEDAEWHTHQLQYDDPVGFDQGAAGGKRYVDLVYEKKQLTFDGDVDSSYVAIPGANNFPALTGSGGNQVRAHGSHTRITKVELYDGGTQLIGVAQAPGETGDGAGDLGGQIGEGNEIDANDLVDIKYIVRVTGDTTTSEAYVDRLAETVRDGPDAAAATPNVAFAKIRLHWTHPTDGATSRTSDLTYGTHTSHVDAGSLNKSVVYLGDPDLTGTTISSLSPAAKTPMTFSGIDTSLGTLPNKVEALTSDNITIGHNDIVEDDYTTAWSSGDNIKMSYFITIGF